MLTPITSQLMKDFDKKLVLREVAYFPFYNDSLFIHVFLSMADDSVFLHIIDNSNNLSIPFRFFPEVYSSPAHVLGLSCLRLRKYLLSSYEIFLINYPEYSGKSL